MLNSHSSSLRMPTSRRHQIKDINQILDDTATAYRGNESFCLNRRVHSEFMKPQNKVLSDHQHRFSMLKQNNL